MADAADNVSARPTSPAQAEDAGWAETPLDALAAAADAAALVFDADGRLRHHTPQAAEWLGVRVGDRGAPVERLTWSLDPGRLAGAVRGVLDSGRPVEFSTLSREVDPLRVAVIPYPSGAGRGAVLTVTRGRRVEAALADAAAQLELALAGGNLGTYTASVDADGDGEVVYDARAQTMLIAPATTTIAEATAGVHPDDREALADRLALALDPHHDDPTFVSVHRYVRPDGATLWLALRGQALFEGDGAERRATRLLGVLVDVTEVREAREQVRSQLAEVESYFDALPVGVAVLDRDGRYVRVNRRLVEIGGVPASTLLGRRARDVFPDYEDANEPYVHRVLATGVPVVNVEMRMPAPHTPTSLRDWLVSFYPLRSGGDVTGVSVVIQDVTAIRRAEAGLARLNAELEARVSERTAQVRRLAADLTEAEQRERRRVAQVLHDDLQQILYALQVKHQLITRALAADGPDPAPLLGQAEALLDQAIHATRTLTVDLSPPVLRGEGLDRTLEWLAVRMKEAYGLDVAVDSVGHVEVASNVQVLLFQVVRELLFNVVKHAGTASAHLRVERDDDLVRLTVADRGVGFAAPTDDERRGFGLLSVHERLQLAGGRLDVDSTPGGGTRVVVTCPAEP